MNLPVRLKFVKLVRDEVPNFYPAMNVIWQKTDPAEATVLLQGKLVEEVIEYLVSGEVEELSDIIEIITALAHRRHDTDIAYVLEEARRKQRERGGYAKMIGLYVEGADHGDKRLDYDTITREP